MKGGRLTPEGASGYQFYVIEAGTMEVRRDEEPIAPLGPGDFFGEMAIMGDGHRIADVVATSPMALRMAPGASASPPHALSSRGRQPWVENGS